MWCVVTPVMSATVEDLAASLFQDPNFDEKVLRFASDAGCQVVYITRDRHVDVEVDGESAICHLTHVRSPY